MKITIQSIFKTSIESILFKGSNKPYWGASWPNETQQQRNNNKNRECKITSDNKKITETNQLNIEKKVEFSALSMLDIGLPHSTYVQCGYIIHSKINWERSEKRITLEYISRSLILRIMGDCEREYIYYKLERYIFIFNNLVYG